MGRVVEPGARHLHRFGETRVLRALVAVDERGHVPGVLRAERAAAPKWHVRLDEGGGLVDGMHAGAPVVGALAPQRGKHLCFAAALALAVGAMAQRALGGEHRLAALQVGRLRRRGQLAVAGAGQHFAHRRALGHPEGIGLQRHQHIVAFGRRLAVHAVGKAPAQAFGKGVHMLGFGAVGRVQRVGAPQWRRMRQAPGVQVAVDAVERVADKTGRVGAGVQKNLLAAPYDRAHGGVGNVTRARRLEQRRHQAGRRLASAGVGQRHQHPARLLTVATGRRLRRGGQVGQARAGVCHLRGQGRAGGGGLACLRRRVVASQFARHRHVEAHHRQQAQRRGTDGSAHQPAHFAPVGAGRRGG